MGSAEKFWDKKAAGYAKSPIADEATYQRKLTETQSFLSADMNLLEFGCGPGSTAVAHAPYVKHIDAIDISENMLAVGRERAQAAGVDNIDFSCATLETFEAEANSIDAVLGLSVMHLIADRRATLLEIVRILKPGGVFISSTACIGNSIFRLIRYVAPLAKLLGIIPDVFVMSEAEWAKEVQDAGLTIETQWHHGKDGMSVFMVARKLRLEKRGKASAST